MGRDIDPQSQLASVRRDIKSVSLMTMSPGETAQAVEAGGLKLHRVVEVPPYHYGAVFERPAS